MQMMMYTFDNILLLNYLHKFISNYHCISLQFFNKKHVSVVNIAQLR